MTTFQRRKHLLKSRTRALQLLGKGGDVDQIHTHGHRFTDVEHYCCFPDSAELLGSRTAPRSRAASSSNTAASRSLTTSPVPPRLRSTGRSYNAGPPEIAEVSR